MISLQTSNHLRLLLFICKFMHLKHHVVDIFTALGSDDEAPMAAPPLEAVQLVFGREHGTVCLELFTLLRPIDKGILLESLYGEIHRLIQVLLAKLSLRPHIKYKSNIFVIIHITDLLRCGHSNVKFLIRLEEGTYTSNNTVLLDALQLVIEHYLGLDHVFYRIIDKIDYILNIFFSLTNKI